MVLGVDWVQLGGSLLGSLTQLESDGDWLWNHLKTGLSWFLHLQACFLALSVSTQCLIFQGLSSFRTSTSPWPGVGTPVLEDDMAVTHLAGLLVGGR